MAPLVARAGFALLLLALLAAPPGTGFDTVRIPVALGGAALALAAAPRTTAAPAFLAGGAFLALQILSLARARDPAEGFAPVLATACGLAAFAAARRGPTALADARRILPAAALALAAWAVVQALDGTPPAAAFGNPNYAGAVAALLLPALAGWGGAWPSAGAAGALVLLAVSGSRGGLLGAAAGLCVLGLLERPRRGPRLAAAAALLLLPLVAPARHLSGDRASTLLVRLDVWTASAALVARNPWGVGAGQFGAEFPPYRKAREFTHAVAHAGRDFPEVEDAHSAPVHVAAETGLPGLLAWGSAAILALVRGLRRARENVPGAAGAVAALAAGGVAGLFNALPAHAAPAILFGAFAGLADPAPEGRGPAWPWRAGAAALAAALLAWVPFLRADLAYRAALAGTGSATAALGARPGWWRAEYQAGVEEGRAGRAATAAEHYRRALERRPFHGAALNNLAVALLQSGRPPAEAESHLRRALEGAPHYYLTRYHLGLLRRLEGRWADAREEFRRATELHPGHGSSWYALGETFVAEGRLDEAVEPLLRARERGLDVQAALRRDHPERAPALEARLR